MRLTRKPIHLAAHFPGVNNTTVWTDPSAGSQIEFDSFVHLARTAERGLFDFFFLAEGLRLREHRGRIHDLDVVGRPDTFTVLAALAGVTDRIGLTGTINTTFNEPFEVARQFATLDHLSDGRAGWNIVTSSDAFTGANFRRGGFLDHADRYPRAEEFLTVARAILGQLGSRRRAGGCRKRDVCRPGPDPRGRTRGRAVRRARVRDAARRAAGSSDPVAGRRLSPTAGRSAPGTPTPCSPCTRRSKTASATTPTSRAGRSPTVETLTSSRSFRPRRSSSVTRADEAEDKARHIRYQQVSGATAIAMLEQVWGRDLSGYDPDGPLPDVDPTGDTGITQGRVRHGDPVAVARRWRERAEAENLSIRELVIAVTSRAAVRRHRRAHRRRDRPLRPGRRVRRVHLGAAPDTARPGRVRRPRWCRCCRSAARSAPNTPGPETLRLEHLGARLAGTSGALRSAGGARRAGLADRAAPHSPCRAAVSRFPAGPARPGCAAACWLWLNTSGSSCGPR